MNVKDFIFGGVAIEGFLAQVAVAVLRVVAGASIAMAHGWLKMPVSQPFIDGVAKLGFPAPEVFAWLAALSELIGGVLVAVGLATRPSALFITVTMGVAAFMQHGGAAFEKRELPILYGAIFLFFTIVGAGRLSFDAGLRSGGK